MRDQAEKLREIIENSNYRNISSQSSKNEKKTRIIAVTSGKGGVGKTNFTINLAISLNNLGYKIIVLDSDIGFANIDVILGIIPKYTLAHVINGEKDILDIITEGPSGIKIISGGSGINEMMQLDTEKLEILTNQLLLLENYADFILVDTGAGLSNIVLSFLNSSDEIILVTTPEPTSLTDGYAMIKALTMLNNHVKLQIIVNRVQDNNEGDAVYYKLRKVAERFLSIKLEKLGYISDSKIVSDSVMNQNPFTLSYPNTLVTKQINNIALNIVSNTNSFDNKETGMKNFILNLKRFFQ